MQIHRERHSSKHNYERIMNGALDIIITGKSKNYVNNRILKEVRDYLASSLVLRPIDYDKNISKAQLRMLEKYPNFDDSQAIRYLESLLQYNQELTYRNQVTSAFTFLETYFNPKKFDDYIINTKELMTKNK